MEDPAYLNKSSNQVTLGGYIETPTGIKIISSLLFLGGFLTLIAPICVLSGNPDLSPFFTLLLMSPSFMLGGLGIASGYGMTKQKKWAYWLSLVYLGFSAAGKIISLLFIPFLLMMDIPLEEVYNSNLATAIFQFIFNGWMFAYLLFSKKAHHFFSVWQKKEPA